MITGLSEKITKSGIPVLRLHYTADPKKCPGTTQGDKWLEEAVKGYTGGFESPRWRKEMEIEYGALSGTKLLPLWDQWKANGRIVVAPFEPTGYRLYGSYDHGWRHPSCYLIHGVNSDGAWVTLWEFHASHVPVSMIAKIIKGNPPDGLPVKLPDGRKFSVNPYAGQEILKRADPSMWAEDQIMTDGPNKSTAYLFEREKVFFQQGKRGGDLTFINWLLGHFWADPMNPRYRITKSCTNLIRELGLLRHKEWSARVELNRAAPEELIDKDNDAWDACKYHFLEFPPVPTEAKAEQKPNSFAWWQKLAKNPEGAAMATYQREMVG